MLLLALTNILYAQTSCRTPLPNQQFTQKFNQLKNKSNERSRLQFGTQLVKSFCFSSVQLKDLASLFANDYDRLEFAKAAYQNITDKENFYDVYDAFIYYSNVFRLHDFIKNESITERSSPARKEIRFPNYQYPSISNYRGTRNCNRIIDSRDFDIISNRIHALSVEKSKLNKAIDEINNICLTTEQLMKIASLLSAEESKLKFAQAAIKSVFDIDQYVEMKQVFKTPGARSQFVNFLNNQTSNNISRENRSSVSNCKVSESTYQRIFTSIKNEKFNTNKINTAKNLIETNKCFSALQIKNLVDLFDYESARVDIAKYAYQYTTNKSEYYTIVSEALGFESSKNKLLDYINAQ